jgi:hypothetical protein
MIDGLEGIWKEKDWRILVPSIKVENIIKLDLCYNKSILYITVEALLKHCDMYSMLFN